MQPWPPSRSDPCNLAGTRRGQDHETIAEARHRRLSAQLHHAGSSFAELQSKPERHAGLLATQVHYSPWFFHATSEEAFGREATENQLLTPVFT
jgi:hypothetical protein